MAIPLVRLTDRNGTNTDYLLDGGGNGYHLYELIYDPDVNDSKLWVDGTQRVSGYAGYAPTGSTGQEVLWGSGSSADQGQGNYNLVQFELANVTNATVPEPQSACAFIVGCICCSFSESGVATQCGPLPAMRSSKQPSTVHRALREAVVGMTRHREAKIAIFETAPLSSTGRDNSLSTKTDWE